MLGFDLAGPWREMSFVSVDVETTGLSADDCRVIEVGMVRFERGQVAERWGSLVNPGVPVPPKITEITSITDEMIADAPTFREIKWEVYGRMRDRVFVAFNSGFDHGFLKMEMDRAGLTMPDVPILDPQVWARQLMTNQRRYNLGSLCDKFGIALENAHRAVDDAEAAGKVLLRFADKVAVDLGSLLADQTKWRAKQEAAFAERRAAKEAKAAAKEAAKQADAPPADDPGQTGMF
jgi:DNA polymerase III epsilon subunit family exonuclease